MSEKPKPEATAVPVSRKIASRVLGKSNLPYETVTVDRTQPRRYQELLAERLQERAKEAGDPAFVTTNTIKKGTLYKACAEEEKNEAIVIDYYFTFPRQG